MGVNIDFCVLIGWKLDYSSIKKENKKKYNEDIVEDKLDDLIDLYGRWAHDSENNPQLIYLRDGMSGKYEIIGKRLRFERDCGNGSENGDPLFIPGIIENQVKQEIYDLLRKAENETGLSLVSLVENTEASHIVLFHYS